MLRTTISLALLVLHFAASAQCAMCSATAETSTASGHKSTMGLNQGILLMVSAPYLVVMSIAVMWWYNKRKKDRAELEKSGL